MLTASTKAWLHVRRNAQAILRREETQHLYYTLHIWLYQYYYIILSHIITLSLINELQETYIKYISYIHK